MRQETMRQKSDSITAKTTLKEILDGVPVAREIFLLHDLDIEALSASFFLHYPLRLVVWRHCFLLGPDPSSLPETLTPLSPVAQAEEYYAVNLEPLLDDLNWDRVHEEGHDEPAG